MQTNSTFILKKDWDELPSGEYLPSPYFSGRKKELTIIEQFIQNKRSGSLLVSAPRGTGKTDLVYKAVTNVCELGNKKYTLIPIVINAVQLFTAESENVVDNEKWLRSVLKKLIVRTYSTCRDKIEKNNDLSSALSDLYLQSASQYSHQIIKEFGRSQKDSLSIKDSTSVSINIDIGKEVGKQIADFFLPGLILILQVIPHNILGIGQSIMTGLLALIFIALQFISVKGSAKSIIVKNDEEKNENVQSAKLSYLLDASLGNLEFGFREFLINMTKKEYKIVFIIDELDKIESEKEITNKIDLFKALFNHSEGLFIFISGEETFDSVAKDRISRGIKSTLFSQKIYISRPTTKDFKEYLQSICMPASTESFEDFKNFIIFNSELDFFNVQDVIRDSITAYSEKGAEIVWDANSGNLALANTQSVISSLLDSGYLYRQPSQLNKNARLVSSAYTLCKQDSISLSVDTSNSDKEIETINLFNSDLMRLLERMQIYSEVPSVSPSAITFVKTNNTGERVVNIDSPFAYENSFLNEKKNMDKKILKFYNYVSRVDGSEEKGEVDASVIQAVGRYRPDIIEPYHRVIDAAQNIIKKPSEHNLNQETIRLIIDNAQTVIPEEALTYIITILEAILNKIDNAEVRSKSDIDGVQTIPLFKNYLTQESSLFVYTQQVNSGQTVVFIINPSISVIDLPDVHSEIVQQKIKIIELYSIDNIQSFAKGKNKENLIRRLKIQDLTAKKLEQVYSS